MACDEKGTGGLDAFTIPGKSGSSYAVYDNGSLVDPSDYTIDLGGGTNGEDRVMFGSGAKPASGSTVTVDFTGRRRYLARFNGGLTCIRKSYAVFSMSFNLIEVLG